MVNCHIPVKFQISTDLLGQCGFRKAYRAQRNTQQFSNAELVVKKYKTGVLKETEAINQTVEPYFSCSTTLSTRSLIHLCVSEA